MNRGHSALTDWGLSHVNVGTDDVVLDVGCGGGRTLSKLAKAASAGRVHGIDHSSASVAASRRYNLDLVAAGRVVVQQASVEALPFDAESFDLVTAVESHFWWSDLPRGLREVFRVVKPGGRLLIIAEFYAGGRHAKYARRVSELTGMAALTPAEHQHLLQDAGFVDVTSDEKPKHGWLAAVGRRAT